MTTTILQVPEDLPYSTQRLTLDGVDYEVSLSWNERAGWFLGMTDTDGVVLFAPRRLALNVDVLKAFRFDARCPPGLLFAYDLNETSVEAGYLDMVSGPSQYDLRGRVALVYVSVTE